MSEHVGVDVGGTFIKAGLVAASGDVLARTRVPTDADQGLEAIEERMHEAVRGLGGRSGGRVGVGLPGIVLPAEGVVRVSPNIPCWRDYPARERLENVLGTGVAIENDANCAAVAEGWIGAGARIRSFLLLTLGTGCGGGVMLDGELWRGESGRGGEIGHVVVDPGGEACGCGSRGCLETVASVTGIERMARDASLAGGVEDLASRARSGGVREALLFESAGRALGIAVADWLNILDVHAIIVAGGLRACLDLIEPGLVDEALMRAYCLDPGSLRVLGAGLGEDSGLVGAARLAMSGMGDPQSNG